MEPGRMTKRHSDSLDGISVALRSSPSGEIITAHDLNSDDPRLKLVQISELPMSEFRPRFQLHIKFKGFEPHGTAGIAIIVSCQHETDKNTPRASVESQIWYLRTGPNKDVFDTTFWLEAYKVQDAHGERYLNFSIPSATAQNSIISVDILRGTVLKGMADENHYLHQNTVPAESFKAADGELGHPYKFRFMNVDEGALGKLPTQVPTLPIRSSHAAGPPPLATTSQASDQIISSPHQEVTDTSSEPTAGPSRFKGKGVELLDLPPEHYEAQWEEAQRDRRRRDGGHPAVGSPQNVESDQHTQARARGGVIDVVDLTGLPKVVPVLPKSDDAEVLTVNGDDCDLRQAMSPLSALQTGAPRRTTVPHHTQPPNAAPSLSRPPIAGTCRSQAMHDSGNRLGQGTSGHRSQAFHPHDTPRVVIAHDAIEPTPLLHQMEQQQKLLRLQIREKEVEIALHDMRATQGQSVHSDNSSPVTVRKRPRAHHDGNDLVPSRRRPRLASQHASDATLAVDRPVVVEGEGADVVAGALTHSLAAVCGAVGGAAGLLYYLASEHAQRFP
ncbi:hypothetical protein LTR27_008351 [Elasticomyces elasticus]|nr:hypothetical protein LTR27_008351 [Elasticomyces elasticus]